MDIMRSIGDGHKPLQFPDQEQQLPWISQSQLKVPGTNAPALPDWPRGAGEAFNAGMTTADLAQAQIERTRGPWILNIEKQTLWARPDYFESIASNLARWLRFAVPWLQLRDMPNATPAALKAVAQHPYVRGCAGFIQPCWVNVGRSADWLKRWMSTHTGPERAEIVSELAGVPWYAVLNVRSIQPGNPEALDSDQFEAIYEVLYARGADAIVLWDWRAESINIADRIVAGEMTAEDAANVGRELAA